MNISTRCLVLALLLVPPARAQFGDLVERNPEAAPIARLLGQLGPDVQRFNQHVVTLANPFMEGRKPGTRGMEIAREYFEFWLRKAGVEPGFAVAGEETLSYRQPFPMRGGRVATAQYLAVGDEEFVPGRDFTVTGLGDSGEVTAPVVFVGYGVKEKGAYSSFPDDPELDGKIAMVLRWEPMDVAGKSQWAQGRSPWSRSHRLSVKVREVRRRGAVGMILVEVPGVDDARSGVLIEPSRRSKSQADFPVMHLGLAATRRLLEKIASGTTIEELRDRANAAGEVLDMAAVEVTLRSTIEPMEIVAENVGGVLRGRGALADEWIVIGGHLDHLGKGLDYGARKQDRVGELHPGADDNATGAAAVLMLADKLVQSYARLPEGEAARSILFVGFDAEEAGLNGARYYVDNPLADLDKHALMINFDMIGRIVNKRLSVTGAESAEGMSEWVAPLFAASPLEVVSASIPGGSDHMAFMSRVPHLFAIIADFHDDYHTPDDVSWKINREDGVHTVHLFHEIALTAATRSERFVLVTPKVRRRR